MSIYIWWPFNLKNVKKLCSLATDSENDIFEARRYNDADSAIKKKLRVQYFFLVVVARREIFTKLVHAKRVNCTLN